jgi:hypothetical protein
MEGLSTAVDKDTNALFNFVEHRKCSRQRDSSSPEGTAERSAGWSVAEPGEKWVGPR